MNAVIWLKSKQIFVTFDYFTAVRDLSEQVDQLHSQLVDLEEEYGRIYHQLQDLLETNRDFTQSLKDELNVIEKEVAAADDDNEEEIVNDKSHQQSKT